MFFFQVNFFLYAITGKAFRHELKRLFSSIAVKMHLSKDAVQKPVDRRTTTFNINYLAGETYHDQRLKEGRPSPSTLQLLRSPQSMDSTVSNGSTIFRHLRQQQQVVHNSMNDVTYCFQRISNV